MLRHRIFAALTIGLGLTACADATGPVGPQPITLDFAAMVGARVFACGQTYTGVGSPASTVAPQDLRFYVHDVRLISATGAEVPVTLNSDGRWQNGKVALLDFENATGSCANGTSDVRSIVSGTADAGDYKGVRFKLGVPFDQNHGNQAAAPSPLNLSSLFWSWNSGYIFWKLDLSTTGSPAGFSVHVGSTGCTPSGSAVPATSCSSPNRADITLAGFRPGKDVIVADVQSLLATTNVDSSAGCHSFPGSAVCASVFPNVGLSYGTAGPGTQTLFKVVPK